MKTCGNFALIIYLFIPTLALAWPGKVVNVSDGDTITVLRDGGSQVKVRLYGIDTPEKAQPFGQKARDITASMVAGRTVDIIEKDVDRYGRVVGLVSIGGTNLNEAIVRNGFAWVYRQYCKESFCSDWSKLESKARQNGMGMWSDSQIIPPWDWRHNKESRQQVAATETDDGNRQQVKPTAATGEFHGNVNSRKFHRPGCQHYDCKNCTATFISKEDAVAAGYSPCGICRP